MSNSNFGKYSVYLGTVRQDNRTDLAVTKRDRDDIFSRCVELIPSIQVSNSTVSLNLFYENTLGIKNQE